MSYTQKITEMIQDIEQLKICMISRGKEVDYIKKEIQELNELYCRIFHANGVIHRNSHLKIQNLVNKKQNKKM